MCYSAKVAQNIKDLARQFAATMDYSEVERLLMERLAGRPIRLARGFEWNFANPQSAEERRIHDLSRQYQSKKVAELEQEVFKQKKRLADAERKLKVKETKAALNERRVATSKIEDMIFTLKETVTILIVTHNMEQAARVADYTGFMYLGELVERGPTSQMFQRPKNELTEKYLTGSFG